VKIAARVPRATYEDRIVNSRTAYLYAVTAVDQHGRESSFSNTVRVDVP
jgi:fibronectin type 3 domain-containing protein